MLLYVSWFAGLQADAQTTVDWNSDALQTNLTSAGDLLDGGFNLELGVFAGSFVPTPGNIAQWAANWHPACRTIYDASNKRYADVFTPVNNNTPFTIGKAGYVWGFRGDAVSSEWILFRASSWTWPSASSFPPSLTYWYAKDATAVLGTIIASGSPFLMQTAAVSNVAPPTTTWSQWQAETLAGDPNSDPDRDGVPNLLEYVFGTPPKSAGAPVATPVEVVDGHLQITIPRRIDHPATLIVEVSDDLASWHSGPAYTAVVSDGLTALVVRDLTTVDVTHPKRFMRLRTELTNP